jgi:hypothetical protein
VLERLAGEDAPRVTDLPIELVVRRSSGPPGGAAQQRG